MMYFEDADGDEDVNEPITGPIEPIFAPVDTRFTRTMPDMPTRYQGQGTPDADELGLNRSGKSYSGGGWRKALHSISGGPVSVGAPAAEPIGGPLAGRANRTGRGSRCVAVLSLKGGAGKTTTTIGLGATFASWRGDRVIAVDANPDFGTLAQRGPNETRSTVRDLLADDEIVRYSDIRRHTSQSSGRLEILASERDPAASEAFSEQDYRAVHEILDRFYNIVLTDCGTGLTHSAMRGVLDTADALVVVASPAVDSARSALATLDWLQHQGYADLFPATTVVVSSPRPGPTPVNLDQLTGYFRTRVRSVFAIPYDPHLAEGGEISLELTSRKTRQAYMNLASSIADKFGQ